MQMQIPTKSILFGLNLNGLQEDGVDGFFTATITRSLIIRDFDDTLKQPLRYVHLFLLCAGQIVLPPSPRASPGTSLFGGLPRSPYHFIFPLPCPI